MKEPYRKGVAIHPDPESCAGGGNIAGEAPAGAHTGQPTQRVPGSEISLSACRPRTIHTFDFDALGRKYFAIGTKDSYQAILPYGHSPVAGKHPPQ